MFQNSFSEMWCKKNNSDVIFVVECWRLLSQEVLFYYLCRDGSEVVNHIPVGVSVVKDMVILLKTFFQSVFFFADKFERLVPAWWHCDSVLPRTGRSWGLISWLDHTKECQKWYLLLGTHYSGFRSPNESGSEDCCCPLLPHGVMGQTKSFYFPQDCDFFLLLCSCTLCRPLTISLPMVIWILN